MSRAEPSPEYELREASDSAPDNALATASLPPADGGRAAWLFLLGSFLIETLLWGFPFSFGVLNDYYTNHEPFSTNPTGISVVGTTCSGIMYLAAPPVFLLYQQFPVFLRHSTFYGLPIVVLAILLSSYATKVWHLILTQGILYSIGGSLLYYPIYIFIDEWFIRRKGFAFGVMWAGSGTGGLTGPLILNWGLSRYGAAKFLRGWAIALLVLAGPMLYFVRARIPLPRSRQAPVVRFVEGFSFIKSRAFWILQAGNIVQGLGYFIPALYLPSYARTLNLSPLESSVLVSLINTASVPGIVLLSALSDRTNVTNVIFISALGSAISIFCFWGFASSLPLLVLFTIFYGFFAGGFTSTYAGVVQELRRSSPGSDLGSIIGLLGAGRGIGNVVCGPLSELLLGGHDAQKQRPKFAYDSSYGSLIVFTGVTAALTLTPFVMRRLHLI